jgi:hypothetical protein
MSAFHHPNPSHYVRFALDVSSTPIQAATSNSRAWLGISGVAVDAHKRCGERALESAPLHCPGPGRAFTSLTRHPCTHSSPASFRASAATLARTASATQTQSVAGSVCTQQPIQPQRQAQLVAYLARKIVCYLFLSIAAATSGQNGA